MSKEFSTPEDITQTVVDEEAFGGYAVETLITPELFYTEDMVKAEYDKMSSAEKIKFQEGVKAAEAYQKAYGHCAPWEYICGELIHKRYKCIPQELVKQIMESGSKTQMEKDTEGIICVKQEPGVPSTSEQVIVTAILPSDDPDVINFRNTIDKEGPEGDEDIEVIELDSSLDELDRDEVVDIW